VAAQRSRAAEGARAGDRACRDWADRACALPGGGATSRSVGATPTTEPLDLSDEDQAKRARLIELLHLHNGNVAAVAREMHIVRSQVQRWMKRYGINRDKSA